MPIDIDLQRAFLWDCDECGRENVLRIALRHIDNHTFNKCFGRDTEEAWHLPETLVCQHCGQIYSDEDEDEEEIIREDKNS